MEKAANSIAELPAHRVDVLEPGQVPRRHRIGCMIGENLKFDTTGLEAYCFANWDVRVFDAFLLAAAVQFCDHTKARSSVRWGREIEVRIPVHDLALWHSAAISGALHAALDFLTGDRWHVEFVARSKPESARGQMNFNLPGRLARRHPVQRWLGLACSGWIAGTQTRRQSDPGPTRVSIARQTAAQERARPLHGGALPCALWQEASR